MDPCLTEPVIFLLPLIHDSLYSKATPGGRSILYSQPSAARTHAHVGSLFFSLAAMLRPRQPLRRSSPCCFEQLRRVAKAAAAGSCCSAYGTYARWCRFQTVGTGISQITRDSATLPCKKNATDSKSALILPDILSILRRPYCRDTPEKGAMSYRD